MALKDVIFNCKRMSTEAKVGIHKTFVRPIMTCAGQTGSDNTQPKKFLDQQE